MILLIGKAVKNHGLFASLWWKQRDLKNRYQKAISKRAKDLLETRVNNDRRNKIIFDYLTTNGSVTIKEAQRILNLSRDRDYLVLSKLANQDKLYVTRAGRNSCFIKN